MVITRVKGLPEGIDPSKPPKNFKDAMSRLTDSNGQKHTTVNTKASTSIRPWNWQDRSGTKVLRSTTSTEYMVVNGELKKYKVRLCVMGNQQKEGVHYKLGELCAPLMKAAKVLLFITIAAQMDWRCSSPTPSKHSLMARRDRRKFISVLPIGGPNQFRKGMP